MMWGLRKILKGGLFVKVSGNQPERFLNIARRRNIILHEICVDGEGFIVQLHPRDYRNIRSILKKTKLKAKIIKRYGFPFFVQRLKKRWIFIMGLFFVCVVLMLFSRFVWLIEIEGGGNAAKNEQIYSILSEMGIQKGVLKSKIDTEECSRRIMMMSDEFAWVFTKIKGTRLMISVAYRQKSPPILRDDDYGDIVATTDGIIQQLIVKNGTPMVQIGDTVQKGDVIIEGMITYKDGMQRRVNALGEVYARTWFNIKEPIQTTVEETIQTEMVQKRGYAFWGEKKIFLWNFQPSEKEYATITVNSSRKRRLPFGFGVEKRVELNKIKKTVDFKKATEDAGQRARKKLRAQIPKQASGCAENKWMVQKEGMFYLEITIECVQNIAQKKSYSHEEGQGGDSRGTN